MSGKDTCHPAIGCSRHQILSLLLRWLGSEDPIHPVVGLLASVKVSGPSLNTLLEREIIFEWCVRCGSKNGHQKDM